MIKFTYPNRPKLVVIFNKNTRTLGAGDYPASFIECAKILILISSTQISIICALHQVSDRTIDWPDARVRAVRRDLNSIIFSIFFYNSM